MGSVSPILLACLERTDAKYTYNLGPMTGMDKLAACYCMPCTTCQSAREHFTRFPDDPRPETHFLCCHCGVEYNAALDDGSLSPSSPSAPRGWAMRRGKSSLRGRVQDLEAGRGGGDEMEGLFGFPMDIPHAEVGSESPRTSASRLAWVLLMAYVAAFVFLLAQLVLGAGGTASQDGGLFLGAAYLQYLLTSALARNDTRKVEVFYVIHLSAVITWCIRFLFAGYAYVSGTSKGSELARAVVFFLLFALALVQFLFLRSYRNAIIASSLWFVPPKQIQAGEGGDDHIELQDSSDSGDLELPNDADSYSY